MAEKKQFGTCPAGAVTAWTLKNGAGMEVTVLDLGGTLQKLAVPSKNGPVDVLLGYDTAADYWQGSSYFGALIGRCGNRIRGAKFPLNGTLCRVSANCGRHTLHGGFKGFDRKLWTVREAGNSLILSYRSPDGEEGFPGNLDVEVVYTLGEDNSLRIDYRAVPDRDTPVNLTSHGYFNLHGGGPVTEDRLTVRADAYTVNDDEVVPTGEIRPVEGTCLDFRRAKPLGQDLGAPMLAAAGGYDNNFCLSGSGLRKAALLEGGDLTMEMETTAPGLQLYCAEFREPVFGKGRYQGRCFVCLEAQGYPDAMNHGNFPSVLVRAGETYRQTTIYRFL